MTTQPAISVVIPTRNRAEPLARLLRAVGGQSLTDFECLVIDDGSSTDTQAAYDRLWPTLDRRFVLHRRAEPGPGDGPGRSRNRGIELARARFIAFCDDDDIWLRQDHLATAHRAATVLGADFYFANMQFSDSGIVKEPDWYRVAGDPLRRGPVPGEADLFRVTRADMARFLRHRNLSADTLVIDRTLFARAGAYFDQVKIGEDLDLPFRLSDRAQAIVYRSTVSADLDATTHPSVVRSFAEEDYLLFSIMAYLRAEALVADPGLRAVARAKRAWRMIDLAAVLMKQGRDRRRRALALAVQAAALHPSKRALLTMAKAMTTM